MQVAVPRPTGSLNEAPLRLDLTIVEQMRLLWQNKKKKSWTLRRYAKHSAYFIGCELLTLHPESVVRTNGVRNCGVATCMLLLFSLEESDREF